MSGWSLLVSRSHVQRSRSNHSSQPTVLSTQYLLTPLLDQYQTWCRGFPQWVDDPYWFSGHMFIGIEQTTSSISFDPFTWSLQNSVQGLHQISRWSLFSCRSHVQRSRSNYSFEPSVLSTLYILISWLLASYRFCFFREDKPEFCTMGGIDVSETFLVSHGPVTFRRIIYDFVSGCKQLNCMHISIDEKIIPPFLRTGRNNDTFKEFDWNIGRYYIKCVHKSRHC